MNVFPVPSSGEFFIENKSGQLYEVMINNLAGKLIVDPFTLHPYKLMSKNLAAGHYTIVVKSKTNMLANR